MDLVEHTFIYWVNWNTRFYLKKTPRCSRTPILRKWRTTVGNAIWWIADWDKSVSVTFPFILAGSGECRCFYYGSSSHVPHCIRMESDSEDKKKKLINRNLTDTTQTEDDQSLQMWLLRKDRNVGSQWIQGFFVNFFSLDSIFLLLFELHYTECPV